MKIGYCQNNRRWLDFKLMGIFPSCLYKDYDGFDDCMYEKCDCYEEREPNYYYKRKMKIIKSYF